MIRSQVLSKHKLSYDEAYKHAEDYGLWMELAAHGRMANLPDVLLKYRVHDEQYTRVFSTEMKKTDSRIKHEYLERIGVSFTKEQWELFLQITQLQLNASDEQWVKRAGNFLSQWPELFCKTSLDQAVLKKFIYRRWEKDLR